MLIDTHVHIMSFPSLENLEDKIVSIEDLTTFRTRYPSLFAAIRTESPVDNSDHLIRAMDKNKVTCALVQTRPGAIDNRQIADAVKKHTGKLFGLFRIGHNQHLDGYLDDPSPLREKALEEITVCVEKLGMKGMGELNIRAFTNEVHPEKIAKDLEPIMKAVTKYKIPIQIPTGWTQWRGGLFYADPIFVDEIAGRHPEVPIILTKMGRSIATYFDSCMVVALRNVNIYFDVVGTNAIHLRTAVDRVGSDRIMFGTDWSATWRWVSKPADVHTMVLQVMEGARLEEKEMEDIKWKTANRIFGLGLKEENS